MHFHSDINKKPTQHAELDDDLPRDERRGFHVSEERARVITGREPEKATTQHAEKIRNAKSHTIREVMQHHGYRYHGYNEKLGTHVYVHPKDKHVVLHTPKRAKYDWHFMHGEYHDLPGLGTFPNTSGRGYVSLDQHLMNYT